MNSAIRLRPLVESDLEFADSLRVLAGWNQVRADWERFLCLEPNGCFLAEWDGIPAGTATTLTYGRDLAWISMVLVHPDFRRRGIGRALLEGCVGYLQKQGVRSIKLDATPLGRPVYESLGFVEEWTLQRWSLSADRDVWMESHNVLSGNRMRPWVAADLARVEPLDTRAFGVKRTQVIESLIQQSTSAWVTETEVGEIAGFGTTRRGAHARYIGPVVAQSKEIALQLIQVLVSEQLRKGTEPLYWDIPNPNTAASNWANENGFNVQRTLTRMYLGENHVPGDLSQIYAIAAPSLG